MNSNQNIGTKKEADFLSGTCIAQPASQIFLIAVFTILFYFLNPSSAFANSGVTYHGRLIAPDGSSVSSSHVQFRLQIRTPGNEDCLLYEEIQTQDLSSSRGVFALSLGDGSGVRQDVHHAWNLFEALANRVQFNFSGSDCSVGPNHFMPAANSNRSFRVFFNDGTFAGWEALPIQTINYIPMSIESYAVGGFPASSLLRVEDAGGALVNTSPLNNAQYNELLALLAGTSNQYTRAGQLNGVAIPALGSGDVLSWNGTGWSAVTPLTSFTESDPNVEAFAKSALPVCDPGEVLFSDGTSFSCVTDGGGGGGWSAVDATDSVKGIVSVPVAGGLSVSSGALSIPDQALVVPGSYAKVTVNQKGLVTGHSNLLETDLPTITTAGKVSGGAITSGEITGTTSINTSGTITGSGISARQVTLYDSDDSHYIRLLTPHTDDLISNYDLILPSSLGSANQVLGMNAAGTALENKSLIQGTGVTLTHTLGGIEISAAGLGGTVSNVTGTAPIQVADGNDEPVISIDDATTTTKGAVQIGATGGLAVSSGVLSLADLSVSPAGNYGSSTEIPSITVDAKGRVTAVGTNTISVDPAGKALAENYVWIGNNSNVSVARHFGVGDLRNSSGLQQIPGACTSSQTMTWSSLTDQFSCTSISIEAAQISDFPTLGTAAAKDFGTGVGNLVELDGTARIPSSLLPAGGYDSTYFKQNGNSFGSTATLGTNDNNALNFETNGDTRMTILPSGNVGIGTTAPISQLHVSGGGTGLMLDAFANTGQANGNGILLTGRRAGGNSASPAATVSGSTLLGLMGEGHDGSGFTGAYSAIISLVAAENFTPSAQGSRILLSTTPIGTITPMERMRIDPNGNVGIGTTNPSANLEISSSSPTLRMENPGVTIPVYPGFVPALTPHTITHWSNYGNAVGGFQLSGFTKTGVNNAIPAVIVGHHGGTAPTMPAVGLVGYKWDGSTGRTALAASEAVAQISNASSSLMTVMGSGGVGLGNSRVLHVATFLPGNDARWDVGGANNTRVRILTQIPWATGVGVANPTLHFAGKQHFTGGRSVNFDLAFYQYNNAWYSYAATSRGGFAPTIQIGNQGGFIAIQLDAANRWYHSALTIDVVDGSPNRSLKSYAGWTFDDGDLSSATDVITVNYSEDMGGLVLTSDGKVGIGTTDPQSSLHVQGSPVGAIRLSSSAASAGVIDMYQGANYWRTRHYESGSGSAPSALGFGYNQVSPDMLAISTTGNVGIGTASPTHKLHVIGTAGLSTGTAWTNTSDERLKDIHGEYRHGLNEILKLKTVNFSYKEDNPLGLPSDKVITGFIAQDVQKVIPEAVITREDGYLELNVDPIHWATVNAVQELAERCEMSLEQRQNLKNRVDQHHKEIEKLKAENQSLQREVSSLKERLDHLERLFIELHNK